MKRPRLTDSLTLAHAPASRLTLPPLLIHPQGGVHVVVGTPGRVYDMLRRRALRADNIKMFVLVRLDCGCIAAAFGCNSPWSSLRARLRARLRTACAPLPARAGTAAAQTGMEERSKRPSPLHLQVCISDRCTILHLPVPQDEADEMLSRGFKDQIYDIFQLLPPKIQVGAA